MFKPVMAHYLTNSLSICDF